MSDTDKHNWSRRTFIQAMGATAAVESALPVQFLESSAKGLTEEAASVEPLVKSGT